jgi:hypothetical protein
MGDSILKGQAMASRFQSARRESVSYSLIILMSVMLGGAAVASSLII